MNNHNSLKRIRSNEMMEMAPVKKRQRLNGMNDEEEYCMLCFILCEIYLFSLYVLNI